jgi:hypothetical protein
MAAVGDELMGEIIEQFGLCGLGPVKPKLLGLATMPLPA